MEEIYKEIGQRIRKEREALGFNQTELAMYVGLSRASSLSDLETARARIQIHTLYDIAEALGVSVLCLLPKLASKPLDN
jgi:transcriptional regulator with XRE-family HTH domain